MTSSRGDGGVLQDEEELEDDGKDREGCMMANIEKDCRPVAARIQQRTRRREEGKLPLAPENYRDEAENNRDEDEANKSKIMTMWFGESEASMRALFSDELSRRDNKGLNNQDGEVLIAINKQRQSSR